MDAPFRVSIPDVVVLSLFLVTLAGDLLVNGLDVQSILTKFVDALEFNRLFRGRKFPKNDANKDFNYSYTNPNHTLSDLLYVYLSNVLLKYLVGGMAINAIFFGKPIFSTDNLPKALDVFLFHVAIILINFSPNDYIYRKLSTNFYHHQALSLGVSLFKARKVISVISKAKIAFEPKEFFTQALYVVMNMEFTGVLRDTEPFFTRGSFIEGIEFFEQLLFQRFLSSDALLDVSCWMVMFPLPFPSTKSNLAVSFGKGMCGAMMLHRWQRKIMQKYFLTDSDKVLLQALMGNLELTREETMKISAMLIASEFDSSLEFLSLKKIREDISVPLPASFVNPKLRIRLSFPDFKQYNIDSIKSLDNFKNDLISEIFRIGEKTPQIGLLLPLILQYFYFAGSHNFPASILFLGFLSLYDLYFNCGRETLKKDQKNEYILKQYLAFLAFAVPYASIVMISLSRSSAPGSSKASSYFVGDIVRACVLLYMAIPHGDLRQVLNNDVDARGLFTLRENGVKKIWDLSNTYVDGFARSKLGLSSSKVQEKFLTLLYQSNVKSNDATNIAADHKKTTKEVLIADPAQKEKVE